MARLTDDMTRLAAEIHAARDGRGRLMRDLRDFASGLRATVAGVRKEFAADLAGAHRAWFGTVTAAMPGRTRRGGQWSGRKSA